MGCPRVDKCAAFGLPNIFEFDPECCNDDVQCGVAQGPCSTDSECVDDLLCGNNAICPNDTAFDGHSCCKGGRLIASVLFMTLGLSTCVSALIQRLSYELYITSLMKVP